ncbi:MAG: hemolysin-III related-domain-containing protein [Benniella sp.]|nr:MAG: hemolysin-III related-domain-containing protein [Benniella sp.]
MDEVASFDQANDGDPEKGRQDQCCSQLPEDTSQDDLGRTCSWNDLPQWMRDNPAIVTGYRRATNSYRKCMRSLLYLHNETVNIWSHLLGAIAFVIIAPVAYYKIVGVLNAVQWTDITVLYAFLAGAIVCLTMSASFHTFCCHSEKASYCKICEASSRWVRCDYLGIIFLIVGSFYPAIFYGFYCHSTLQIIYISLITVLGASTIIGVMRPKFQLPQFRWVRSVLFLALGLSGLCPIIHAIVLYGFTLAKQSMALNYMFCMGATYVLGTLIYSTRVPECFFPGKFDNFMASHQIFHICVLIGCTVHFLGVIKSMAFWHNGDLTCDIPLDQIRTMYAN